MKKVLVVDWDYLVDASAEFRRIYFADFKNGYFDNKHRDRIWSQYYVDSPLDTVNVVPEIVTIANLIHKILLKSKCRLALSDSSMHAYDTVYYSGFETNEPFEVINLDFNHNLNYWVEGYP